MRPRMTRMRTWTRMMRCVAREGEQAPRARAYIHHAGTCCVFLVPPSPARPPVQADEERMGKWSVAEDKTLKKAVEELGGGQWERIALEFFAGRHTHVQCQVRWNKVIKPGLVKGPWKAEEDQIILRCLSEGITKWSEIAERIPGRIGKQCRERYFNHLDRTCLHARRSCACSPCARATRACLGTHRQLRARARARTRCSGHQQEPVVAGRGYHLGARADAYW